MWSYWRHFSVICLTGPLSMALSHHARKQLILYRLLRKPNWTTLTSSHTSPFPSCQWCQVAGKTYVQSVDDILEDKQPSIWLALWLQSSSLHRDGHTQSDVRHTACFGLWKPRSTEIIRSLCHIRKCWSYYISSSTAEVLQCVRDSSQLVHFLPHQMQTIHSYNIQLYSIFSILWCTTRFGPWDDPVSSLHCWLTVTNWSHGLTDTTCLCRWHTDNGHLPTFRDERRTTITICLLRWRLRGDDSKQHS